MINKIVLFGGLLLLVMACKKEEIPVKKHESGEIITSSFEMGSDYRNQAFFDLGTNSFVAQNVKTIWDLGFEASPSGWHVILNSANVMAVARVENTMFNAVTDTIGLTWHWDANTFHLDSTAIGDWRNSTAIYVVDRGMDYLGLHRGFAKLKLMHVTPTSYTFMLANLNGSNQQQITIEKDTTLNFMAFSIATGTVVEVEPPKNNWDISFTQFTHYFEQEEMAYLVTGVLLNPNGVEVAKVFDKEFAQITSDDINNYTFTSAINTIGYEWKYYDFDAGTYLTLPSKNYILKSTEGDYYKLHFIDFYNAQGDKGTPTFELQKL